VGRSIDLDELVEHWTLLADWLAGDVAQRERRPDLVREQFLAECRARQLEPPTSGQIDRIIGAALSRAGEALAARIVARLDRAVAVRLLALVTVGDHDDSALLRSVKATTGDVSLKSMLAEIDKLEAVRSFRLPPTLFRDVAPKVVKEWRDQAIVESPSHIREHPVQFQQAMLAALLFCRQQEITDALVTLLISTVHRIGARANRRVTTELVNEFKKVTGKENLLFRVAEAAVGRPDDTVRQVVYPVVGEDNLRALVAEYKSSGPTFRRTVQTTYQASYTNHYRRGLIRLLDVLQFRSDNSHQPVIDGLKLVRRYADRTALTYYPAGETPPRHPGLDGDWGDLAYRTTKDGVRVVRQVYEIRTFEALCDQLKCKGIWVEGAKEFRNPDEDLQPDFVARRVEHYAALRKPLDPSEFIDQLREEMRGTLRELNDALPDLDFLEIRPRGRDGVIRLTPLEALPEPQNLGRLKKVITDRWGTIALIDALKESVLRSKCPATIAAMTGRGDMDPAVLLERLLLCIYGYGTNTGIRAVAAGEHGYRETELYYVRRRYLTPDLIRALAIDIANATFGCRQASLWGSGSSAVASDSTHFGRGSRTCSPSGLPGTELE
jgi:hypothetical protein